MPLYALLLELVKYDIAFFEFYRVLIENHLYNPNLEYGVLAYEVKPSIFSIMDHPELERIQEYLLSEQGVDKQIENAIYPSLERDKAITFYMERISDSNIRNRLYQKKYQK